MRRTGIANLTRKAALAAGICLSFSSPALTEPLHKNPQALTQRTNKESKAMQLIEILGSNDHTMSSWAAKELAGMGEDAIAPLKDALKSPNLNVRRKAAMALGDIRLPEAKEALYKGLEDRDIYVRSWAAIGLTKNCDASDAPIFAELLKDDDHQLRKIAAEGLLRIDAPAIPFLVEALKSGDMHLKGLASDSLFKMGEPAIPVLIDALADDDIYVRGHASVALSKMGRSALPALKDALGSGNPHIREGAASALGDIGHRSAVPHLIERLGDESMDVRWNAAFSLGQIGDPSALPYLHEAAGNDPDESVRDAAQEAAGAIPAKR